MTYPVYRLPLLLCLLLPYASRALHAQFAGNGPRDGFRDTSVLKPPAGEKVAIIVFEDLGCPACARAHPVERQVAETYHVPLLRYDFPIEAHVWTFDGAVCARYLQDKVGPRLAEEYRQAIFTAQSSIAGKDDLANFTRRWMQQHGQTVPFVFDPTGALGREVRADYDLGQRLRVQYTPTVVVVTASQYQVVCGTREGLNDPAQLGPVVAGALAQTKSLSSQHTTR